MSVMFEILGKFTPKHPGNTLTHREKIFLAAMFNRMNRSVVWEILAACASERFCSDLKEHITAEQNALR